MNIKEEPCSLDLCVQNDREFCSIDIVEKVKSENVTSGSDYDVNTKTEVEEDTVVSKFCSESHREFVSEDPEMGSNNVSKPSAFEPKIEITEGQCWVETTSTETLCIYDDIKHGIDKHFNSTKSPSLYKDNGSSHASYLLSNEAFGNDIGLNIRRYSPEWEGARKFKSEEYVGNDISKMESSNYSETPDAEKVIDMALCLKQSNLLQPSNTNMQAINMENCKSILTCKYPKVFKCNICEKSFKHSYHLKSHRLVHEDKKANKCDVCEKDFKHSSSLKRHKLMHEGSKPHKCNICNKAFTNVANFKTHKLNHEGKKPHTCNICNKAFTSLKNINIHKLIHEGKKPYKCNICDKSFTQLSNLKKHKLSHEGIKPYKCNICNKAFASVSSLKTHKLMIHEGIKPHKCNICDKTFSLLQDLKRHKLIHEDIKPHKCNVCDKTFTQLSKLKTHKLIHEGIKPHKCNVCDKTFSDYSNFKRHNLIHQEKKPR